MSPGKWAAEALGVLERDVASVTLLKDGLTNDSWLVRTARDAVVVRINNPHARVFHVDREVEATILQVVAAAGIGPEVLFCDPRRHVLVTRYLGPTCTATDMHEPERIERIAQLLHKLHRLVSPDSVPVVKWSETLDAYAATLKTLNRDTPLLRDDVRARARSVAVELENASPPPCLCHTDVHSLNLIDRGELTLLDWEYASRGDPYFDLASLAYFHDFDLHERALLLRAYEGHVDGAAMERLAKTCIVFEHVHDVWHEVRRALNNEAMDEQRSQLPPAHVAP